MNDSSTTRDRRIAYLLQYGHKINCLRPSPLPENRKQNPQNNEKWIFAMYIKKVGFDKNK